MSPRKLAECASMGPESLQAALGYHPQLDAPHADRLTKGQLELARRIRDEFVVPKDFESDVRRFGPLSGLTFEERLISSYEWGLLQSKSPSPPPKRCWKCGAEGSHFAREGCPNA
ncbi:hypothetical protein BASA81_007059 [Batrachochytrium salamandrivorans]|nr:hypothetical protein BASA81_010808 [Batrachochytrium salamandrivorans]KAH9254809.1 hypothetical protein BASA81_007059 [Batrachochytrium salamandrivorans]